jgi:alpha-beta hydrolase superfamily lysophospholipase
MPWYARSSLRVLSHSWRGLKLSGRITGRVPTDDAQALRQLHEDPLVIHRARMDALWGLADLMDAVTSVSEPPPVPVLILYGAQDKIVPAQAMCAWIQDFRPTGGWRFAFYPDGWHLLTRDRDARTVHDDLAAWFMRPGVDLPSGADGGLAVERLCGSRGEG